MSYAKCSRGRPSFLRAIQFVACRWSLTMLQAVDPSLWQLVGIRMWNIPMLDHFTYLYAYGWTWKIFILPIWSASLISWRSKIFSPVIWNILMLYHSTCLLHMYGHIGLVGSSMRCNIRFPIACCLFRATHGGARLRPYTFRCVPQVKNVCT